MKHIKYFEDQETFKEIRSSENTHAYIIEARDEFSSKEFSHLLALYFICGKGCYNCPNCAKVLAGTHPDLKEYPKKNKFIVEDSKDLIENTYLKPLLSKKKVFIINEFDKATPEAMNKILKVLEEPPKNVIFILNTVSFKSVLPTILSRCLKYSLQPLERDKILSIINEEFKEEKTLAVEFSEGYLGKALEYAGIAKFDKMVEDTLSVLRDMKNSSEVLFFSQRFLEERGASLKLNILERMLEDMLLYKTNNSAYVAFKSLVDLKSLSESYKEKVILEILKRINIAKKEIQANVNPNIIIDNLLLSILEVKYLCK